MAKNYEIIHSGLGNRLLYILELIKANPNEKMNLLWKKNDHCNGHFNDYFAAIQDVTITPTVENGTNVIPSNRKLIHTWFEYYDKKEYYDLLHHIKLNKNMESIVNEYIENMGNFIAIHIRRTDFKRLTRALKEKGWCTDDLSETKYYHFIDQYPQHNIFLATDCPKIRTLFSEKYKDRIHYYSTFSSSGIRKTSLQDAVIDMFICTKAQQFLGTRLSTYSIIIDLKRATK